LLITRIVPRIDGIAGPGSAEQVVLRSACGNFGKLSAHGTKVAARILAQRALAVDPAILLHEE
jgi:hypothetical protein